MADSRDAVREKPCAAPATVAFDTGTDRVTFCMTLCEGCAYPTLLVAVSEFEIAAVDVRLDTRDETMLGFVPIVGWMWFPLDAFNFVEVEDGAFAAVFAASVCECPDG